MKRLMVLTVVFVFMFSSLAFAAAVKTYQATGPVLAVTDDMITIDKGKEGNWDIARTADTKVTGDLKVGAKVTIEYKMVATKVDVKEAAKEPAKKK